MPELAQHPTDPRNGDVVFVYPTRETLWAGIGQELYKKDPVFQAVLDGCDDIIRSQLGWSLCHEMMRSGDQYRLLEFDEYKEPFLTSVQIALTEVWRVRDIRPGAVFGCCVGEFAAAYAAGAIDLYTALTMSCRISRAFRNDLGRGRTMMIQAPRHAIREICDAAPKPLYLAAVTNPGFVLVACDAGDYAELTSYLIARTVQWKPLNLKFGLHTPLMDSWQDDFIQPIGGSEANGGRIPIYSAATGGRIDTTKLDPAHWWQVIRSPLTGVEAAVCSMIDRGYHTFVEVSGNPSQCDFFRAIAEQRGRRIRMISTAPEGERAAFADFVQAGSFSLSGPTSPGGTSCSHTMCRAQESSHES